MNFKITEMTTTAMKVEYADGSWARITSAKDQDKTYYLTMIARYHHSNDAQEVAIADHPMKIGDEGVVGEGTETDKPETTFDYGAARISCYPSTQQQWDAAYHTRKGDSTLQTKLDAHIDMVKAKIPADDKIYSVAELAAIAAECAKDSAWVADV